MKEKIFQAFTGDIAACEFAVIDALLAQLATLHPFTEDERAAIKSYEEAFLPRFVCDSNALEGSTLSLGDTALVIEGEFTPTDNRRLSEIFAARGGADGTAYANAQLAAGRPLSEELIKDIHERTALDMQPRTRRAYRSTPVFIAGSLTVPAEPSQVREFMADLLFAAQQCSAHPIARAAAFHAMFETVHPFQDCNGRTGRVLLNFMLQEAGYFPIAIKHNAGASYKAALEQWQVHANSEPFIQIVSACVETEIQQRLNIIQITRA